MSTWLKWTPQMQPVQHWSFRKVALLSMLWLVLSVLLTAAWTAFDIWREMAAISGSGGIGGVSVGLSEPFILFSVLPAMILVIVWVVARVVSRARSV